MDACVGKIVELLADGVVNYVKRHGAYVIRYKNKVQLLEQENKQLGEIKDRIQRKVDRAENNGKVIEIQVSSWLKEAENMEGAIANFLQQENRESFKCFKGCICPNLMWRHKTGKEADTRKSDVSKLISGGDELEKSPVARDAPFESDLKFYSSQYYTTFQSRASVVEEIKNALKDYGVDMIGVHGPGGAGKTTMVKEVAKDAEKLGIFHKIAIAVVSKDPNTSKLQEDIATQLNLEYKGKSELERADGLRKALLNGKRKILVILDDLWQFLDLTAIGIPTSALGVRGCKILLTSRNIEVFHMMEVRLCFSIGYLEEEETWELFTKVTGEFGVDGSIARKVSERCGGLPIAIVAVGAALRGQKEFVWNNALHQLEKCPLEHIEGIHPKDYTPLRWSYDFLKEKDAKSCFLLCCLFPEDAEISIDDLVKYSFALGFLREVDTLKVARDRVKAMVNMLKSSCLLLNGEEENFVKMHDVIRDLAISITKEKQTEHGGGHDWPGQQRFMVNHDIRKWPKNDAWKHHTAISLRINDDNFPFPCDVLNCPLVHTLVLESGKSSLKIPNNFFQSMKEAKVLDLKDILLDLRSSILELDYLRMLRLNNCQLLGDMSTIQNLKNRIEILSFKESTIEELPQEIRELTHLRSLNLMEWNSLKLIPKGVISNLINLEELYVTEDFKGWDTTIYGGGMSNASIAELKSLTQLTVLYVSISAESSKIMVQECPDLFKKLINFNIFISIAYPFHDQSRNVLKIEDIHHIDDKFHLLMDKVDVLKLSKIQDLRYLFGKPQLQFTPSGGRSFSKLTYLGIVGCNSLKYLFSPSCAKALKLQKLKVSNCSKIEQIIGVGDYYHEEEGVIDEAIIFSRLKILTLRSLSQFRSFCPKMEKTTIERDPSNWTTTAESIFNEKVSFPVLEELKIDELLLKDIWSKQTIQFPKGSNKVSFSQLKNVNVTQCHNLVNVFPSNMLPRLQNLERLRVRDCSSLTLLIEDLNLNIQSLTVKFKFIDVFPKLRDLELWYLPKLMKIWLNDEDYCSYDNSVHLCLKTISIMSCGSLRYAFSAFVARHLALVQHLSIKACPGMEVIVSEAKGEGEIDDGTIAFKELKELWLKDLPNLRSFYEFKFEAPHLFNYQDACPNVKTLYLGDFKSIGEIQVWDLATIQEHLHNVSLIRCQVSTKVFSHHMKRSYRMIHLQNCRGFKHVIDLVGTISVGEEHFIDVKRLKLYDLPELVSLWNNNFHEIGAIRNLKYIHIKNCPQMKNLLTDSMPTTLQHLETLAVQSCEMMEEIIVIEENNINIIGEEKATWIEFSKLESLILIDLPNLKSFCNDERGSFNFSSLRGVRVENCPKMKTFVFGQICLPSRMMQVLEGDNENVEITNLNAYFGVRNEDSNHMSKIIHWGNNFGYFELCNPEYFFDDEEIVNLYSYEREQERKREYYRDD
ncbi:probable disease resistance protein At4g27220 isoform X2 [Diospyros lotus]|uniref:probable disease resistance protein At4g27220 isoform X2 n=1 Tax=Diospyros lotus TaxID=55363 RepID=UPI00224E961C|nr:probable disease resistance protein At4g27220 isoform X2 [Diospyros lotus]